MPTVMITGAGRGLGLEMVKQYAADGWRVIATVRTMDAGRAFADIAGKLEVHLLDVTDHASVERLAGEMNGTAIDLLINNAGIYGSRKPGFDGVLYDEWENAMRVNVFAPTKVMDCFMKHVAASELKIMATLTSIMGSVGNNTGGGAYVYRSSKAAMNAVVKSVSIDVKDQGVTVVALHPGWVQTDMGGASANIDAITSATGMRKLLAGVSLKDTGGFFNYDGSEIPW